MDKKKSRSKKTKVVLPKYYSNVCKEMPKEYYDYDNYHLTFP